MKRVAEGFTLVEIMIVVAIIGLLASIAIPAFMKARNSARRNGCLNNLRQIDGAKDQYALEYGGTNGAVVDWPGISFYIKDITNKCFCPTATGADRVFSNSYSQGVLGVDPTCRISPGSDTAPDHSMKFK
jgi:prepilin-type N-terminal cleavage/methylation domain-containing protein